MKAIIGNVFFWKIFFGCYRCLFCFFAVAFVIERVFVGGVERRIFQQLQVGNHPHILVVYLPVHGDFRWHIRGGCHTVTKTVGSHELLMFQIGEALLQNTARVFHLQTKDGVDGEHGVVCRLLFRLTEKRLMIDKEGEGHGEKKR